MASSATPQPNYRQYFGRYIAVNMDTSTSDEDDYKTVEGKVLDVTDSAMAIKQRNETVIVPFKRVIGDVEIMSPVTRSRVQKRKLLDQGKLARKHLADRHGKLVDQLNLIDEESAVIMHNAIDHSGLGHRHEGEPDRHEANPAVPARIRQRKVDDSDRSTRQHMADRHGYPVAILNATTEVMLKTMHDGLNHDRLAHRHNDLPPKVKDVKQPRPSVRVPVQSAPLNWNTPVRVLPLPLMLPHHGREGSTSNWDVEAQGKESQQTSDA